MKTVGGTVTPSFTLTGPTQITVPAGGTATAIVSLTGQNGFSGTIQPAANSTAKFPADQTFTVTPAAPTVTALATFTAGANTEGVFTDQFTAVDPASGFFIEYDVQVTVATEPKPTDGTAFSVSNGIAAGLELVVLRLLARGSGYEVPRR